MADTAVYRIFFFDDGTRLVGHGEFAAASPRDARLLSAAIFDACNDECATYEVWLGRAKLVTGLRPRPLPDAFVLSEELNALAVEVEERIASSKWAVAHSRRLRDVLEKVRARCPYDESRAVSSRGGKAARPIHTK